MTVLTIMVSFGINDSFDRIKPVSKPVYDSFDRFNPGTKPVYDSFDRFNPGIESVLTVLTVLTRIELFCQF